MPKSTLPIRPIVAMLSLGHAWAVARASGAARLVAGISRKTLAGTQRRAHVRGLASLPLAAESRTHVDARVNSIYEPGVPQTAFAKDHRAVPQPIDDQKQVDKILEQHADGREWSKAELEDALQNNTLYPWDNRNSGVAGAIRVVRGEGVYFYDDAGKKYLDFNSQAMCLSLGHTPPQSVVDEVTHQLQTLAYGYGGVAAVPVRAKMSKLLADIVPGDINTFMFPSSGAEANEAAMRLARLKTGRNKIFAKYRSYHGGTSGALAATGDQRRWAIESTAPSGIIHFFDPYPYSFKLGATEEEITDSSIAMLHEQLKYEGPHNVAAIMVEGVTGTNGLYRHPKGYLEALRAMCDKYGILLIVDEVMSGFGRSGRLFGFCHADGVVPDIITFAKGVNGAFLPLAGVGVRDHVADFFRSNSTMYGSTYNGHPVAVASGYAVVKHMLKNRIVEHAAAMEAHMVAGMERLAERHPSFKQGRMVGLMGGFDLCKNKNGDFVAEVTQSSPAMARFKNALLDNGLYTMLRGHQVFCLPPLIITPEQIQEGFDIFDKCLDIMDEAMED